MVFCRPFGYILFVVPVIAALSPLGADAQSLELLQVFQRMRHASIQGNTASATIWARKALELGSEELGPRSADAVELNLNLAKLLLEQEDLGEAARLYRIALAIKEELVGPGHPDLVPILQRLAEIATRRGDLVAAEEHLLRAHLDVSRGTARDRGARRLDRPARDFDLKRARALYQLILGPAEGLLDGVQKILLIPDAGLQSLPLHLLVTSPTKEDSALPPDYSLVPWLARKYATTVLPSVASLASLRRITTDTKAVQPFLGIGDPLLQGGSSGRVTADATALVAGGAVADEDPLRHAMLAVLSDPLHPRYAHPRYWAPFVIVGDGR